MQVTYTGNGAQWDDVTFVITITSASGASFNLVSGWQPLATMCADGVQGHPLVVCDGLVLTAQDALPDGVWTFSIAEAQGTAADGTNGPVAGGSFTVQVGNVNLGALSPPVGVSAAVQ